MKISFRKYVIFLILPVIAAGSLLYYVASNNVSQYLEHETDMAAFSISATDSLLQQYLKGLRDNVGYFVKTYKSEIKQLASNPDDSAAYSAVEAHVREYFPDAVTFTIANNEGYVMVNDVGSLIGKGCRENIRLFSINSQQSDAQLRIHSDSRNYHFDIMHEMHTSDGRVFVFFVSFDPVKIAGFISNLQMPGHKLMIIKKNSDLLIEVTAEGARVKLNRSTSISEEEQTRILATQDVANSLWQLVDILEKSEIKQSMYIVFRDFGVIFASFVFGILLAFAAVLKHEKLRYHAENKLKKLSQ